LTRSSMFGLSLYEMRILIKLHEDVHVVDTNNRYSDLFRPNAELNRLIRQHCFPGR